MDDPLEFLFSTPFIFEGLIIENISYEIELEDEYGIVVESENEIYYSDFIFNREEYKKFIIDNFEQDYKDGIVIDNSNLQKSIQSKFETIFNVICNSFTTEIMEVS
jgi:hypothetical protein